MKVPAFFTKPDESTRIFVPVATLSYFPVFIFYCLLLFFKRKYLKQGKEIQQIVQDQKSLVFAFA